MKCTCGKLLQLDEQHRGQQGQCPSCGNLFVAGAAVASTTGIQAETRTAKVAGQRASTRITIMSEKGPIITRPWLIPPLGWVLIFIFISCIAAGVLGYFFTGTMGPTSSDVARMRVRGPLTAACQAYFRQHNRFPDNLGQLLQRDALGGPYLEHPDALVDPWENQFQYDPKGPKNNRTKPDIWTVNPRDGALIGNWPKGR
jgi:hypothetical protein